jgi:HK97 gp10 family phage protein
VTLLGLPGVLANLGRIAGQIELAMGEGLEEAAEVIREAWVDNIESEGLVDTGYYRDSIRVDREGNEVSVLTDVEYSRFLEFGTSDTEAHPVAERAAEESGEKAIDAVADRVGRVIR